MLDYLDRADTSLKKYTKRLNLWTNVYGLARTILALSTLLTLLINPANSLFRPIAGFPEPVACDALYGLTLFCLFPYQNIEFARWIGIAILAVTAIGWRPSITAIPHWWISFSIQSSARVVDGGEQIAAILCLFIIPIAILDRRKFHWQTGEWQSSTTAKLIAISSFFAIRVQVAIVYFHAAVAKFGSTEWLDGTALYYWFLDPYMGAADWLKPFVIPALKFDALALASHSVLLLELLLSAALFMPKRFWRFLIFPGIVFHVMIGFTFGIPSFAMIMTAALILHLRPTEDEFVFFVERKGDTRVVRNEV